MNYESFEKKMNKLQIASAELVTEYEERCDDNFEDNIQDLYQLYTNLSNIQAGIDPVSAVLSALHESIQQRTNILDSFNTLISRAQLGSNDRTVLQRYFSEISRVYDKNKNEKDVELTPENADKLIEMNLKTVISIAKGYQGLGLTLEELISAGNMGLVICAKGDEKTHKPKYDPKRAKLKEDILSAIEELDDDASEQEILGAIQQYMTYGDVKKKFWKEFATTEKITSHKFKGLAEDDIDTEAVIDDIKKDLNNTRVVSWNHFTKAEVVQWVKKNIKNATFNSVAFLWIRAYILIAIDAESRLVKKPKAEIYNDKKKYGSYRKEITLDIDAPVNDDSNTSVGDMLCLDDDEKSALEVGESYDVYKECLNKLLDGVKPRDRSVFLKKFGIGLPRPMLPKEIAEQENLSIARISQIFQQVAEQIQANQVKYNINLRQLFEEAGNLN